MVELSQFTGLLVTWIINPLFWLLIIMGFLLGVFFVLNLRKKNRLKFTTLEFVDLGKKNLAINTMKSGYFGKKLYLKGLWWSGEEVLRLQSGEIVRDFSTEDHTEINGRRGVICYRDPLNQEIIVPINRIEFKNKELVADIAPSSYRDAAVDIFNEAVRETADWKDKVLQFISWALVVIFALVAIIVIVQYVKNSQEKAAELLLQAGQKGAEACRNICIEAINAARGSAAP